MPPQLDMNLDPTDSDDLELLTQPVSNSQAAWGAIKATTTTARLHNITPNRNPKDASAAPNGSVVLPMGTLGGGCPPSYVSGMISAGQACGTVAPAHHQASPPLPLNQPSIGGTPSSPHICSRGTGRRSPPLLSSCAPPCKVVSFLYSVTRRIMPGALLGSKANWRKVLPCLNHS